MTRPSTRWILLAGLALSSATALPSFADNASLDKIHQKIERTYPNVSHIRREALDSLPADTIYFDVREPDEFAVSHIAGAVQVSPAISENEFMALHGEDISGKTVVFYCSVGRRSSRLIDRLDTTLTTQNTAAYNLEGSIFRWHNDEAPLANEAGATSKVHPYNWIWSRHLDRRSETSYKPAGSD